MISSLISFALRLVLAVATVVLVLALLAVALVSALGLLLWSLLRGRRPTLDMSAFARARQFRAGAGFGRGPRASGEVVDVQAREVQEVRSATPRLE